MIYCFLLCGDLQNAPSICSCSSNFTNLLWPTRQKVQSNPSAPSFRLQTLCIRLIMGHMQQVKHSSFVQVFPYCRAYACSWRVLPPGGLLACHCCVCPLINNLKAVGFMWPQLWCSSSSEATTPNITVPLQENHSLTQQLDFKRLVMTNCDISA